jgi:hypothetical protein
LRSIILGAFAALVAAEASAHSLSPGYERRSTAFNTLEMQYKLTNAYSFPASYEVQVFDKDWTQHAAWSTDKRTYNLNPNSERFITVRLTEIIEDRRVIVCTILTGVTRDQQPPKIESRACSRLRIDSLRR